MLARTFIIIIMISHLMLARTSLIGDEKVNKQIAKAQARILLNEFCIRHPEVKGTKRDHVKDIYFYALKFGKQNIPTDYAILNEINLNIITSAQQYEYEYIKINKPGIATIHWKDTDEPMTNIDISKFKNYNEFRSVFKGNVNEIELKEFWNKMRAEEERKQLFIKLLEDEEEYEEILIPKIKKN